MIGTPHDIAQGSMSGGLTMESLRDALRSGDPRRLEALGFVVNAGVAGSDEVCCGREWGARRWLLQAGHATPHVSTTHYRRGIRLLGSASSRGA